MPRKRRLPDGMWLRGRVYYARFRKNGREIRERLSTDFQAACEMLNDLRARADKTDFGLIDNDYQWAKLKKEFLCWAKQAVRDSGKYESDLAKFEEFSSLVNIREIDVPLLVGFREWRLSQPIRKGSDKFVCPRTVNRQVGTLKNMLNKGVEWKRIGHNPIGEVKPLPHDKLRKKRRSLSLEEVQAIFDASPDYLRPVWLTYMTTGVRRSELVEMLFDDIDFERKVWVIPPSEAKDHEEREIPLDDTVVEIIIGLRDLAEKRQPVPGSTPKQTEQQAASFSRDHVFVSSANTPLRNNLLKRFYAICKRADIEGAEPGGCVDIHALRVSFITLAIEHGSNPKAIQMIVGHSSLDMTMNVYAKTTDKSKREAINALPFANVSPPPHVISLRDARAKRTEEGKDAKGAAG